MHPDRVDKLRQEYTDQYVKVEEARPELARFQGMLGKVKTINFNGRALVQFDGLGNRGWYDVELDYLKVVDPPEPEAAQEGSPSRAEPPEQEAGREKLSPLELARLEKEAQEAKKPKTTENTGEAEPN